MKKLVLAVCGVVSICSCGGGGGGGGGTTAPAAPLSISVSISPSTPVTIDQGQAVKFTATVLNDTNSKGVTWSASGTGVAGTECGTFSSATTTTATYDAPSTVPANLNITITATSETDPTKSASAMVIVTPPPSITAKTLTEATPNASYSATLEATGGAGALTWSVASGALPIGLSLSASGAITGDPTASGTATFTVQVTDSSSAPSGPATAQAPLTLTVVTAVSITTTALPAGSEGTTYLAGVDATGGTPPYTWSLATGTLPPGLTMPSASGVISGVPTSQGTFAITIAAQDSSPTKQTQTQSLSIPIGAPGPLSITTSSLLDGTVNMPYTAMVAVVGGTPPYNWSISTGGLPAGLILNRSTGAISGTPSSIRTSAFAVAVVDSSSPPETQSQALNLTVANAAEACTSSGNNTVLSGPYAFSLSGFNDAGFIAVVGSFTADGTGKITAGEVDTNGVLGAQNGKLITSAYSVGSDNRGCATLATPFGTFVTHFALGSMSSGHATCGRITEWDSPSASAYIASGQLLAQTSSAFSGGLTGSYVFRTVGWDPSSLGGREVCVGALSAGGYTFNALEQDCNDAWTLSTSSAPALAGAYTALDANGRGTGIITLGDSNFNVTLYMVSSSQLLVVNADPVPFASGEWDQRSVPAGGAGFTQASLDGNMVLYLSGLSLAGTGTTVSMETASADGTSSMAITFYEDRAGTMQVSATDTCAYTVEPNGRVTLGSATQTCGSNPPVFYLAGLNTGFIVDTAPGVDMGSFEPQSAGPFNNASLAGSFFGGMAEVAMQTEQAEVDPVAANGSAGMTGTADITSMSAQDAGSCFLAATYTVNADGTFSVSSSDGAVAGIIISSSKFVMFSPATFLTATPTLLVVEK